MTVQDFLKTLRTAKNAALPSTTTQLSSSLNNQSTTATTSAQTLSKTLIFNSSSNTQNVTSFLESLTSYKFQSFLSDPHVYTFDCLRIFNAVLRLQPELPFKPDLHAHLTLICRLIKSRDFSAAEILLKNAAFHRNYRYPFSDFTSWVENYCPESRIITKLLNMLLKMYSDHRMFDMACTTFDYMVEKGIERDEKTCSVHLYAMITNDKVDLAFEFFHRMLGSGMEVSVYSVTIVVSGLCKVGELKMGRELVEDMSRKGVKPNIITCNTLVDGCVRWWDLTELDHVLCLMEREHVQFNDTTYKLLIEGYSGCEKVEEAEKLLMEMYDKGIEAEIYLFHIVIRGYCRLGNISSGLAVFRKMQERELNPSVDIYWCLINGLCEAGEISLAKKLVEEMQYKGGELDDIMRNTLIDVYSRNGMMDEVAELQRMRKMKCSTVDPSFMNSMDSESEIELVMDEEAKPMILDDLK